MLNTLRRGPASITRVLHSSSTSSTVCIRIARARQLQLRPIQTPFVTSSRALHSSPQWRRYATATAEVQDEAIEGQIADEVNSQRPPSNADIDISTRLGRVTKFHQLADLNMVSPVVVKTLTQDMGLETMTQVQSLTINETLKGIDVLAQARTGTGKTLAFLIPVLQNIVNVDPTLERRSRERPRVNGPDIRAIIISPTRELAEQIAVEAQKVVKNTGVIVQTAVGGSAKTFGLRKIQREGCHILVATPGRLNDVLSDPYSQIRAPKLSAFVLDEADRLLDQGFAPDIQDIQDLLPKRSDVDRQTLLFSATVPREVMDMVRQTMKPDFKFVRTVQEGEQQTHEKVPQKIVNVGGLENVAPALLELCKREIARDDDMPFKAIIYFGATAEVALASSIFENLKTPGASQHPLQGAQLIEMHAKLTQQQRTRSADMFRRAKSAIMFSSDVTARGMDFPNVTHIIQVGLPQNRDTYIHRVGRTARGDKKGEAWIFITDMEAAEAPRRLQGLPLQNDDSLETAKVDMTQDAQLPGDVAKTLTQVVEATRVVPFRLKCAAYMGSLGVYGWMARKQGLIDTLNNRSKYAWGMDSPPAISASTAQKLGLSRLRGINIGARDQDPNDNFAGSSRGFDRGGSRGGYGGDRSGGRPSYGGARESYGGQSFPGGGRPSYGGDRGSHGGQFFSSGGRQSYGGDRGSYGDQSSSGGDRSSYGGRGRQAYGGGDRARAPRHLERGRGGGRGAG